MDYQPRVKSPIEHHRDVLAIAQQQLALACARSLCEPENKNWSAVITRLMDWLNRLESDDERRFPAGAVGAFAQQGEAHPLPN